MRWLSLCLVACGSAGSTEIAKSPATAPPPKVATPAPSVRPITRAPEPSPDTEPTPPAPPRTLENARIAWPSDRQRASFTLLGGDADESGAFDISADASTIVGFAAIPKDSDRPVIWRTGERIVLDMAPGAPSDPAAVMTVSENGNTIGVRWISYTIHNRPEPFLWRDGNRPLTLEQPGGDAPAIVAISSDGNVVAAQEGRNAHVIWTAFRTSFLLQRPSGRGAPVALSADGRFLAVHDVDADRAMRIDRRTKKTMAIAAGAVGAMTRDGQIFVIAEPGSTNAVYRGTKRERVIEDPPELTCVPRGISDDGGRVVGECADEWNRRVGFLWDKKLGMKLLTDLLREKQLDLQKTTIAVANGICARGVTIVGIAHHAGGRREAFVAIVPR